MRYIIVVIGIYIMSSLTSNSAISNLNRKIVIEIDSQTEIPIGKTLIAKSDCMGCHKENKKIVGPSFLDIAKKYKSDKKDIDYLSAKITQGGKGIWGPIPMNAHPTMSKKDADEIVRYILSIKE